jgi:hypothetical protein
MYLGQVIRRIRIEPIDLEESREGSSEEPDPTSESRTDPDPPIVPSPR